MTNMTEAEAWAQLQPLRRAILDEMVKPVQMTALGLDELVDRVTVAVAKYMAGVVPATAEQARRIADEMDRQDGTVHGIRPHLARTQRDLDLARHAAEVFEAQHPITPERAVEMLTTTASRSENCDRAPMVVTDLDRVDLTAAASRTGEAGENATGRSVAGSTCWDCGAPVTETKHGRATLHRAGCQYPGERGPQ